MQPRQIWIWRIQHKTKCQRPLSAPYISVRPLYIHNMTCKTFLKQFTGPPLLRPSLSPLLKSLPSLPAQDCAFFIYTLFFPFSFFFFFFFLVFSLCMQILSDLSELCVSVREPLWFGVTEDCTHGDCIHWAYSEPCISNWDVSMCSHIPTTKL